MSCRGWIGIVLAVGAVAVLLWPQGAFAAEQCEALNPSACMDGFLHNSLVQVMRSLWFFDRPLLMIARWVEGLREYLVDGVLATAFDATIAGIQTPFWIIAGIAWCIFVGSYMISMIADLRWVNLRKGIWYCLLAALLFHWGSQGLAATEELRASVAQGFARLAEQSVDDTGASLTFYASNDSSVQAPRSIYSGDTDCPGASTKREDADAMYLNDFTANYLWATATDIHCASATGGSTDLPQQFATGNGTFQGYVPKQSIDSEPKEERARLIGLAQDGVMRLVLGLCMGIGSVLEQVLHLLFTLALATAWMGLLISLLFVLFVSTEEMFTSQIKAGLAILRTSWLASIWVGIMLAVVRQAANTGNAMVVFGAVMLATAVILWQIKGAFELFLSTLSRVAESATGAAPGAIGGMLSGLGMGAAALATGGAGAAVMGGLAALNRNKGFKEAGGGESGQSSGAASYGAGVAMSRMRPLRRAGQLAKAMGVVPSTDPIIQGLTDLRSADPLNWVTMQRDQKSGTHEAQRLLQRQKSTRPDNEQTPVAAASGDSATEQRTSDQPAANATTPNALSAATPARMSTRAPGSIRTDGAESNGSQPVISTPAAMKGKRAALDAGQATPLTPRALAQQIGALATAVAARPNPEERAALIEQIRPLVEAYYRTTGQLPITDPAMPLRISVTPQRTVRVSLLEGPTSGVARTTGVAGTSGTAQGGSAASLHDGTMRQLGPERRPPFRFVQRSSSSSAAFPLVVDGREGQRRDDDDNSNVAPVSLPRSSKGYRRSSKRGAVGSERRAGLRPSTSAAQPAAGLTGIPSAGISPSPAATPATGSVGQGQSGATSASGTAPAMAGTAPTGQGGGPVNVTVDQSKKQKAEPVLAPSLVDQRPNSTPEGTPGSTTGTPPKAAATTSLGPNNSATSRSEPTPVVAPDVTSETLAVPVAPVAVPIPPGTPIIASVPAASAPVLGTTPTVAPASASMPTPSEAAPASAPVPRHSAPVQATQVAPAPSEQAPATASAALAAPAPRANAAMPTVSTAPATGMVPVLHAVTPPAAAPAASGAGVANTAKISRRPWANRAAAEPASREGNSSAGRARTGLPRATEKRK